MYVYMYIYMYIYTYMHSFSNTLSIANANKTITTIYILRIDTMESCSTNTMHNYHYGQLLP